MHVVSGGRPAVAGAVQSADVRPAAAIGREARLELVFESRRGRTVLAHAYAEPPFRVGRVYHAGGAAQLILGCTGPGVFAGDALRQDVRAARGARVVLLSQSALQIHPAAAELPASIDHTYVVDDDAELQCQWDAVIPFAGARLVQRFAIDVAASGRLYWGDALMAGRVRRGEAWQFESLAHELRLRTCGALTYLERYTLVPARRRFDSPRKSGRLAQGGAVEQTWAAGRARYAATALVHHPRATAAAAEVLQSAMTSGAVAGVDLIAPQTIVGRIIAADGAAFSRARSAFLSQAQQVIFDAPTWTARK